MSFEFWLFFCFTVFIASIIPGPSMLLALTHGIKYGFRKSFATAFGNVTATFIQAVISISGLSVILTASDTVFHIVRWLGAAYLIYVGISLFFSKITPESIENKHSDEKGTFKGMFFQAFLVAFGNPKAIVFFTALFPQFISVEKSTVPQFILLISSLLTIAFVCILIYAYFGLKISGMLKSEKISSLFGKITGLSFLGAGFAILFEES